MKLAIMTAVAAGALFFVAADYALSIPNVYVSFETRECVSVENFPGFWFGKTEYSCENMPSKFNHVWAM